MRIGEVQQPQTRRGVRAWAKGAWLMTAVAIVAVGVWASSFWFHAAWIYPNGTLVGFARGQIHEASFPATSTVVTVPPAGRSFIGRNGTPMWWSPYFASPPLKMTISAMPLHWWAAAAAAGWWGLIWWRLRVLREPHECWQCTYDRRGIAAQAACPECGAPAKPPAAQA